MVEHRSYSKIWYQICYQIWYQIWYQHKTDYMHRANETKPKRGKLDKTEFSFKSSKKGIKILAHQAIWKKTINNRDKPFKALFQEKYDTKRHFNQNFLYWCTFFRLNVPKYLSYLWYFAIKVVSLFLYKSRLTLSKHLGSK